MLLETCRYKVVDGKVTTKMFGMGSDGWDIDPGWHHDPKAAKVAYYVVETPLATEPAEREQPEENLVKISRFAQKLADELCIDASKVVGTGKGGSITKDDVTEFYNNLEA